MTDDRGQMTDDRGQRTEGRGQRAGCGSQKSPRRRPSSVVCLLLLAFNLMIFSGCGRKAPPFLPQEKDFGVRVDQLEGAWEDGSVILKGVIKGDDETSSLITGCRVYYVWYPLDAPPCEGCPIEMKNFRDITSRIINDHQFECPLPAFKQKGVCFIMVRIMAKEGRLGPVSDRIKLISDM